MKFPGVISLRNDLPTWAMPNGGLPARELEHVLEVDEDALRGLRAQVDRRAGLLHRADRRLEHQVEVARRGQVALGELARVHRRLAPARERVEMVGAEALLAGAAVDERIGEAREVPGGLPRARVLEDRRVQRDDVVALLEHRAPPRALDVASSAGRRSGRSRRSSRRRRRSRSSGRRSRAACTATTIFSIVTASATAGTASAPVAPGRPPILMLPCRRTSTAARRVTPSRPSRASATIR